MQVHLLKVSASVSVKMAGWNLPYCIKWMPRTPRPKNEARGRSIQRVPDIGGGVQFRDAPPAIPTNGPDGRVG